MTVLLRKPYSANALVVPSFIPPPKQGRHSERTQPARRCDRCGAWQSRYRAEEHEAFCAPCQRHRDGIEP